MCSPIKRLIQATQEIIAGQFPEQIQVDSADEVGELTEKFNGMIQILRQRETQGRQQGEQVRQVKDVMQARQLESEFLSDVSHELRTPLTSIRSFCDLLLMFGDDDPEAREEFLTSIVEACDRLTRLVNDVLDTSKMAAGKIEWNIRRIDLIEIIQTTAQTMVPLAHEKGLRIITQLSEESLILDGDRDRLIQVLTNLINNAIKFTATGQINVSVKRLAQKVRVTVSDTGIGIASEYYGMIFDRFTQVKTRDRGKPTGTGLGLAICKEIVEQHEGEIGIESQLGQGSTFYFTLPTLFAHIPDNETPKGAADDGDDRYTPE